jgi:predicted  nucleic acid-binding Zn-ribbon protein
LCKEFTESLRAAKEEVEKLSEKAIEAKYEAVPVKTPMVLQALNIRVKSLMQRTLSIQPAINDLARAASQQIEHSDLDFADKFELKLRLAELQSQMNDTQMTITGLASSVR